MFKISSEFAWRSFIQDKSIIAHPLRRSLSCLSEFIWAACVALVTSVVRIHPASLMSPVPPRALESFIQASSIVLMLHSVMFCSAGWDAVGGLQ